MQKYKAFSPDIKVLGEVVDGFLQCISYNSIAPYLMRNGLLGRHGLQTVVRRQWYDLQDWLNVLRDLEADRFEATGHLISIGIAMFDTITFPPAFADMTVEEALAEWGGLYASTHRGTYIGEIYTEEAGIDQVRIVTRVPYPDAIHFGLFYALLSHHCPDDRDFVLEYDETTPRRDFGGQHTIYHITLHDKKQRHLPSLSAKPDSGMLLLELPSVINDALLNNRILNDMDFTFRLNGKHLQGAISLRPSLGRRYQNSGSFAVLRLTPARESPEPVETGESSLLTPENLCAQSAAMRPVLRQAQVAARAAAPVLITGESGTGRGFLARAIHTEGSRSQKPLVTINCRAVPSQHIIHEILGGAGSMNHNHPSQFEIAHQGTLLFIHIDSLPLQMQETLLYVIENRMVVRLGETQRIPVDVRIMGTMATNVEQLVAQGTFLPELYYHFKIFQLHLPPLRKRNDDIPLLVDVLLDRIVCKYQVDSNIQVADEVMEAFNEYPWPGNIREMETVLEFAFNQHTDQVIRVTNLPEHIQERRVVTHQVPVYAEPELTMDEAIRQAIVRAGQMCNGSVTNMAELLGISRTTLWRQMKKYNITAEQFM